MSTGMYNNYQTPTMTPAAPTTPAPVEFKKPNPSIELSPEMEKDLVQVFKLLADETRLKVLTYLVREGELHVSALCERLKQSQPAVSHHLALLRVAGLIEARRDGKHNYYSVKSARFRQLVADLFTTFNTDDAPSIRFADFEIKQDR